MKKLLIIGSFLQKNIFPLIVIFVILTVSLFILVTEVGEFQYQIYARNVFQQSGLENSVYFCSFYSPTSSKTANQHICEELTTYAAYQESLSCLTSVEYGQDDQYINMMYQSDAFLSAFRLNVTKGRWLDAGSDQVEVVLAGFAAIDRKLGEIYTFPNGINATVVGLIEGNTIWPSFNTTSSHMSANDLFVSVDSAAFINMEQIDKRLLDQLKIRMSVNSFICFEDDASQKDLEEILLFLEQQGLCYGYQELLETANANIREIMLRNFPLPVFLLIVMSISLICVGAVMIQRTMPEQAKYYLMGCSKKQCYALVTGALFCSFIIPILLNFFLALFAPHFLRIGRYEEPEYIINVLTLLPMGGYALIMLSILSIMPLLFRAKQSPIQMYRRNLS